MGRRGPADIAKMKEAIRELEELRRKIAERRLQSEEIQYSSVEALVASIALKYGLTFSQLISEWRKYLHADSSFRVLWKKLNEVLHLKKKMFVPSEDDVVSEAEKLLASQERTVPAVITMIMAKYDMGATKVRPLVYKAEQNLCFGKGTEQEKNREGSFLALLKLAFIQFKKEIEQRLEDIERQVDEIKSNLNLIASSDKSTCQKVNFFEKRLSNVEVFTQDLTEIFRNLASALEKKRAIESRDERLVLPRLSIHKDDTSPFENAGPI